MVLLLPNGATPTDKAGACPVLSPHDPQHHTSLCTARDLPPLFGHCTSLFSFYPASPFCRRLHWRNSLPFSFSLRYRVPDLTALTPLPHLPPARLSTFTLLFPYYKPSLALCDSHLPSFFLFYCTLLVLTFIIPNTCSSHVV